MLNDETKKGKGKKGAPKSGESPSFFTGKTDPAIVRLMTTREQWTPAQKRADKRAEDAARARGRIAYDGVLALLEAGNLPGAVRAITPFQGTHYFVEAYQAVALAQVQAGELLAAVATAQRLPYADTKGDTIGVVIKVLLQRGDLAGAQWLAATVTGFRYVSVMQQIVEAQQQAGDTDAARRTLVQTRVYAEGFGEGDSRSGFFRSYYLSEIAKAQVRLGDVAGATDTAQLITHQEERSWALRAIAEGTAPENTGPI